MNACRCAEGAELDERSARSATPRCQRCNGLLDASARALLEEAQREDLQARRASRRRRR